MIVCSPFDSFIFIAPLLTNAKVENYDSVPAEQFLGDPDYANFWMAYRQNTLDYFSYLNRYSTYEIYMNNLVDCDQGFPGLCFDVLEGNYQKTISNKDVINYYSDGVDHTS